MVLISLHNISAVPDIFFAFSKGRFTSIWPILLPVQGISAVIKCVLHGCNTVNTGVLQGHLKIK